MLAEVAVVDPTDELSDRPLKKRRVAGKAEPDPVPELLDTVDEHQTPRQQRQLNLQTVEDSSASDDDDESDFGFEDVDLEGPSADQQDDGIADVSVSMDSAPKRQVRAKRKPASAVEKAHRLQIHKTHVLCLLGHCIYVNSWCNDVAVHRHLRPLLAKNVVSFLNPKPQDSQFRQNEAFMDGLRQASDAFRGVFEVTKSGMRSAQWDSEAEESKTEPMDRSDFIAAAESLEGSQDTGNQLLCALLRAVGVEARLVCSLQPLPFHNPSMKPTTPQKIAKPTFYATASATNSSAPNSDTDDATVKTSITVGKVPSARRRLGQPSFVPDPTPTAASSKPRKIIRTLKYPIFWVEAFNSAHQKWVATDPIVTATVAKPSKLEPPSSYHFNQLSYAIAFEQDCVARDVTRRYARAFNAKTRRTRVESAINGSAWFNKVMRFFRRKDGALDRDQVEDAELSQREAREGLPTNVMDFKDHPYYALERHMRRHEVIYPRREVGKVNAGTAAKPRMEAVFRRTDVCVCRSADKWFRLGRQVKESEQPLKRIPAPRSKQLQRSPSADPNGDGARDEERVMTPLYSHAQTALYVPPPVRNGKVPRNAFENLDIYVASMVPAGGVHVRHPSAREAARNLGVDWADAVVGFKFEGRRGTPVVEGVVIPEEAADAVRAVIDELLNDKGEDEAMARSRIALAIWRKFMVGLRIRERVAMYGTSEEDAKMTEGDDGEDQRDTAELFEEGGFMQSDAADDEALPTAGRFSLVELTTASAKKKSNVGPKAVKKKVADDGSEEEAEFSHRESDDNDHGAAESQPSKSSRVTRSRRKVIEDEDSEPTTPHEEMLPPVNHDDDEGGGFLADVSDDGDGGGGFMPDTTMDELEEGGGFVPDNDDDPLFENGVDGSGGGFMDDDIGMVDADDVQEYSREEEADVDTTLHAEEPAAEQLTPDVGDFPTAERPGDQLLTDDENTTSEAGINDVAPQESGHLVKADATPLVVTDRLDVPGPATEQPDESDRGSMLSHDPEDEDAEPDWLESD